jgi:metal-responsive CopG/Arc/MetJ family transcriptional regulator
MYEVEMIALSIKLPTQLAEQSQVVAKKLGITRSELIRRALIHEIEEAEAGMERRSMAESFVAMQANTSEVEASQALDHAFDEPLPVEADGWWRG